ncbi:MAG: helix-turn-helix transcriptional regulator [Clostridia bacterium]|nr:helix-turn-helix transcriptional regulator [Clostridia bacterium]
MGLFNKNHSVGKTIASLRKSKGWTQVELAEKLNVSDKAVSKWEKDDSSPSVEFFPALADLFGVSIDYLMTGKAIEPKIVPMSRIELCTKKDDVALFKSLAESVLVRKDDNEKTILDYMLQYDCKKVIEAFFEKYPAKKIFQHNCSSAGYPCWYTEKVMELLIRNSMIDQLESVGALEINYNRYNRDNVPETSLRKYRDLVLQSTVSNELKERFYRQLDEKEIAECFRTLLTANDKKQTEVLWSYVKALDEESIDKKEAQKKSDWRRNYPIMFSPAPCKEFDGSMHQYFAVTFPIDLIEEFLNHGFFDIAKQANAFNAIIGAPVLNEEKFTYAKAKERGSMTKKELAVLKLTVNGVIDVAELLKAKDLSYIKETLQNNPIHIIETLNKYLKESNWRGLFEFFVDNRMNEATVIQQNIPAIKAQLLAYWNSSAADKCVNKDYLYTYYNGYLSSLLAWSYGRRIFAPTTLDEIITKLQECRTLILKEHCWKLDKEKIVSELTKEFFESELFKGNTEIVIVKLCVKLEAILRSEYHSDEDLSDLMQRLCSQFETFDDEANNYDPYTPRILNKLRIQRNNIVHSEKSKVGEELTPDEIQFCIDYICNMQ